MAEMPSSPLTSNPTPGFAFRHRPPQEEGIWLRFGNQIQEIVPAGIKRPLARSRSYATVQPQPLQRALIPLDQQRLPRTCKSGSCCSSSPVLTHSGAKGIWLNWRGSFVVQVPCPLLSAGSGRDNPTLKPSGARGNYKRRRSRRDAIKPPS